MTRRKRLALIASALAALLTFAAQGFAAEQPLSLPRLSAVHVDAKDGDWPATAYAATALADVRVGHRPTLPASPTVHLGWDDQGLLVIVRAADTTPVDSAMPDGDQVEILVGSLHASGKGFQLAVLPARTVSAEAPKLAWTDKRADTTKPLTAEVASTGDADGYVVEARLPWSDFPEPPETRREYRVQVQVEDAAAGLDRVTFALKSTTESRWLEPAQLALIRLEDRATSPVHLAVYAEYQRYRRTQVRITDTAADGPTHYLLADAQGRTIGTAEADGRSGQTVRTTVDLPMPQNIPSDRTITVTREAKGSTPAESASVIPAGPLGREDALAVADFHFDRTVFYGTAFPLSDFVDPLAIEDLIGPYTVTRRFFDADFNEVGTAEKPGRYGALITFTGQSGISGQREVTLYRTPKPIPWHDSRIGGTEIKLPPAFGVDPAAVATQQPTIGLWLSRAIRTDSANAGYSAAILAGLAEAGPNAPPFVERTSADARDDHWWHLLEKKLGINKPYKYMTVLPAGYDTPAGAAKTYPLIVFLHGSGQCGDDPQLLADWGPMPVLSKRADNPFIAVAPRCPYRNWWRVDTLDDLLDDIAAKYRVDHSRIYLTGLSMGGDGTSEYAAAFPQRLAAVSPMCANGDYDDVGQFKQVPIWAFEGANDPGVDVHLAESGVAAIKAAGGDARLTAYADGGHDIWDRAYQSDAFYAWLLAHQRKTP